jgi:hypothetical protein
VRHLYPMDRYSQLGESLGGYIRVNNPSTQQIQAFLGDLLANDELLLPMRDVVARPSFGALAALAGSGNGTVQRDAIVQELARSYLPAVVSNVKRVLTGMLALTDHGGSSGPASTNSDQSKEDLWSAKTQEQQHSPSARSRITVNQLADEIKATSSEVISILLARGIVATATQALDRDAVKIVLDGICESEEECDEKSADLEREMANSKSSKEEAKRLAASAICDETLWNRQRDPEIDKRFLEAWNLRWFNKRYRPRLSDEPDSKSFGD